MRLSFLWLLVVWTTAAIVSLRVLRLMRIHERERWQKLGSPGLLSDAATSFRLLVFLWRTPVRELAAALRPTVLAVRILQVALLVALLVAAADARTHAILRAGPISQRSHTKSRP
jgi:precorrin-6x reductase